MPRQLLFREEARAALLRGMDKVADAVGATLGPRGQTVVLGRPFGPAQVTKDGVTVARALSLPDPYENEGAKLIQEVAQRTNAEAGDGTTAATILTRAIFAEGYRQVTAGADPQALERGIRLAVECVVAALRLLAQPISQDNLDQIRAVATIAANGDTEMGGVIAEAIHRAGLEGNFSLDTSPVPETTVTLAEGLQIQRGFLSPLFCLNRARGETVFQNCNLLLTERRLIDPKTLLPFLQMYQSQARGIPLLIVAEDVEQGALQLLAANFPQGLMAVPIRAPGGPMKKEELEDIAVLTSAKVFTVSKGDDLASATMEDLGSAERVVVTPHRTTIAGGQGSPMRVTARLDELRSRIADPETKDFDRALLERRLAALSSKVAVIRIGSSLQSKLLEKRDRAEDSLNATLAALKEGIVPGGGTALIRCLIPLREKAASLSGDEATGAGIVARALTAPLHRIASNAGQSGDVIVAKVLVCVGNVGYNAAADRFEDLIAAGIIDPVKVVRLALQNAAEMAGLLLTSAALVVDIPETPPAVPPIPTFRGGPQ